jgi:two-component system response regulator YesN
MCINPRSGNRRVIDQIAENMREALAQYTGISISIGISGENSSVASLPEAFRQAQEAYEFTYFSSPNSVIYFEDLPARTGGQAILLDHESGERIHRAVEFGNCEAVFEILNSLLEKAGTGREYSKESVLNMFEDILFEFSKGLKPFNKTMTDISEMSGKNVPLDHLRACRYFSDAADSMRDITRSYFVFLSDLLKASQKRREIQKAMGYIQEHYARAISLSEIAEAVHISKNYLCSLFKQETGKGISEYMACYRVERAKELLKTTDLKIYEIASRVGYENIYYFSGVFKKVTGMSPLEYKRNRIFQ